MQQSSRYKINYPSANRSDTADVPRDFASVVAAIEQSAMYGQGTLAARPISTGGTPGIQGRFYMATDQTPMVLYYDYGTGWQSVGSVAPSTINQQGLYTNRPAANAVQTGTKYFATDKVVEYISTGSVWLRLGDPAGATTDWFNDAVVPTGWVLYDGSNLPSGGGIYDELATHLGGVATPDTRGRLTVSRGTHADLDHVLDNDGLPVGKRRVAHNHTIADPGHVHPGIPLPSSSDNGGAAPGNVAGTTNSGSAVTGITVGPQTGNEPTDGSAFITAVKIAKL